MSIVTGDATHLVKSANISERPSYIPIAIQTSHGGVGL